MRTLVTALGVVFGLLVVTGLLAFANRSTVGLWVYAQSLDIPVPLAEPEEEGEGVTWFDDYFTVEYLDEQTIAIGEPRYHQKNFNYLILGSERAVLFDSGPGVRDIKPVVDSLTNLPVTVTQSHFHYDHVGNHARFDSVAMIDLAYLRERATNGALALEGPEHLGFVEGIDAPTLTITEWWKPGESIALGDRLLRVLHVPGHTTDSMILVDEARGQIFSGDYLYEGPLFAFLPNSSMAAYLDSATGLRGQEAPCRIIYPAHRLDGQGVPSLGCDAIKELERGLENIRDGKIPAEGFYPSSFRISDRIEILTDVPGLIDWNEARADR